MGTKGKHWVLSGKALENRLKRMMGNQINKGRIPSKETRTKMSAQLKVVYKEGRRISAFKGKPSWNKGKKLPYIVWNKGLKGFLAGEKSPHWIADRMKLMRYNNNVRDRRSYAYVNWRREVWKRDDFKCRIANQDCNGRIEAHHILSWSEYVELRYEINNGITLCHAHHPSRRAEEKRLVPVFQELVSASKH